MSYNLSELQNGTTVLDLVTYANKHSNNTLMGLTVFSLFFVFLFLFKRFGIDRALAGSSYICFVLSLYLTFAELLSFYVTLVFLMIMAFASLFLYVNKNN